MANFKTDLELTAPSKINVNLVREDHMGTSNIFRVLFEIFLSIFSAMLGIILSKVEPSNIEYSFLVILAIAAISFLILSIKYYKDAK